MTQEQKDRNIRLAEALESGKYRQARGKLMIGGGFCCLGVGCDLASEGLGIKWIENGGGYCFDDCYEVASNAVQDYYGWGNGSPLIDVEGRLALATAHNDGMAGMKAKSFPQIAQGFRKLAADSPLEAS